MSTIKELASKVLSDRFQEAQVQEPEQATPRPLELMARPRTRKHITPDMLRAWRTARPWLLDRLPELETKGWTRRRLLRADQFSYPHGSWGPAWSNNWLRPEVQIQIDEDGAIRFEWTETTGKTVSQAARPKP